MLTLAERGFGWQRGIPDFRDYTPTCQPAKKMLRRLKGSGRSEPSPQVDLREYFPPPYDQQHLNSSPAQACVGLYAYFERRAHGKMAQPSRMFLHNVVRRMAGVEGDTGSDLRSNLKAIRRFGMPPEKYWPHAMERFDDEPDAFLYSFAGEYRSLVYVRLEARNSDGKRTLEVVKSFLDAGFPSVFGFPVPNQVLSEGDVPYRPTFDRVCGGQAVVAVGYDDRRLSASRGALLIRNSWGAEWGDAGYGWLPYIFVEEQLAVDFWTLLRPDWLKSGEFYRPQITLAR